MFPSTFLRSLVALAMLASWRPGVAARVGELVVREGDGGMPCFTISQAEQERGGAPDFDTITVAEVGAAGKQVRWRMAMSAQRTFPVTFQMCIPYAGRLAVLPQTAAAALEAGKLYEVAISARSPPVAAPREYRARFCLVRGDGTLRLGTPAQGGKHRPVCDAPQH